jgi:hypothetical protein
MRLSYDATQSGLRSGLGSAIGGIKRVGSGHVTLRSRIRGTGRAGRIAGALMVAGCLSAGLAPAALAAPAHPSVAGSYTSWAAAQHAARFKLLKPGKTFGLKRSGRIQVETCVLAPKVSRKAVFAGYSGSGDRSVQIQEVNYHIYCGNAGEAKTLGHYRVDGVRATLLGSCGLPGLPSCHKLKISLDLLWVKRGKSYALSFFAMRRATVVAFARAMRAV